MEKILGLFDLVARKRAEHADAVAVYNRLSADQQGGAKDSLIPLVYADALEELLQKQLGADFSTYQELHAATHREDFERCAALMQALAGRPVPEFDSRITVRIKVPSPPK